MNLTDAPAGATYVIEQIDTRDDEMDSFLARLGAFPGQRITLLSKKRSSCIVVVKNGRYSLDLDLARAVRVG